MGTPSIWREVFACFPVSPLSWVSLVGLSRSQTSGQGLQGALRRD